jgi:hypothetical protein
MVGLKRAFASGVIIAGISVAVMPVVAQRGGGQGRGRGGDTGPLTAKPGVKIAGDFDKVKILEPGGPVARTRDGHPDLSGRYYPNHAGRMLQGAYRIPEPIMRQFDPEKTPQENPVFRPEAIEKYQHPTPYGTCPPGGTPTSITTQATEHGPLEIVQVPGRVWLLTEFPQTIRMVPTDGRQHPADPDTSFNGDSVGRWEGDTLVIDTVAIDTRMRNISVGRTGDANAWLHSEKEHVMPLFEEVDADLVYGSEHLGFFVVRGNDLGVLYELYPHTSHVLHLGERDRLRHLVLCHSVGVQPAG